MKRWSAEKIALHRAGELHVENDICRNGSACRVISVDTLEALIQAVGYLSLIFPMVLFYIEASRTCIAPIFPDLAYAGILFLLILG